MIFRGNKHLHWIILLILYCCVLFYPVNSYGLRAEEPRRAVIAIEMIESNNFINPHLNGLPYYNKPPLFNWLLAFFFRLFNSFEEWVVRLPSLLSLLTIATINFFVIKKYLNLNIAILSSFFFLTSADILFYGTITAGEIDLFYSLIVYLHLFFLIHYIINNQVFYAFLFSYLLTSIGFLTKGFPSIAIQCISLIVVLVYSGKFRYLFSLKHLAGILLFLIITGAYFYLFSLKGDLGILLAKLFNESSSRFSDQDIIISTLKSIFNFVFDIIPRLLLPWLLFIPLFFRLKVLRLIRANRFIQYIIIVLISNIIIYSVSPETKIRYIYPFLVFFSILFAFVADYANNSDKGDRVYIFVIKHFGIIIFIASFLSLIFFIFPIPAFTIPKIFFIPLSIMLATLGCIYYKSNIERLFLICLFMILLRLGYNQVYLKYTAEELKVVQNDLENIEYLTSGYDIYLTGNTINTNIPQLLKRNNNLIVQETPLDNYEVSYYFFRNMNTPLLYSPVCEPGSYYISSGSYALQNHKEPFYTFVFDDENRLVLFKK